MDKNDDNVSLYLRRPLRTYEQFLREQATRARRAGRPSNSPTEPSGHDLPKWDEDDVKPRS
jgi:hypothetical protein